MVICDVFVGIVGLFKIKASPEIAFQSDWTFFCAPSSIFGLPVTPLHGTEVAAPAVYSLNLFAKVVAEPFTQKYILLLFPVTWTVSPSWQSARIASFSEETINNLSSAPFGNLSKLIVPEVIAEASKEVGAVSEEIVIVPELFETVVPPEPTILRSAELTVELLTFILLSLLANEFSSSEEVA